MGMSFGSLQAERGASLRCSNCLGCFLWKIEHIPRLSLDKILYLA